MSGARERVCSELALTQTVCVCVRERHIRDMRGHSSISHPTDRHTAITRRLSARGPVWETGWAEAARAEDGGRTPPNSTQQHLIQIITWERRRPGGGGHTSLTLSCIDRARTSQTREPQTKNADPALTKRGFDVWARERRLRLCRCN